MKHEERLVRWKKYLEDNQIPLSKCYSPGDRILHRLGLSVPPSIYWGFWISLAVVAVPLALFWGLWMGIYFSWTFGFRIEGLGRLIAASVGFGIFTELPFAILEGKRKNKLKLPSREKF
jgi:hypothetical protein